MKIKLILYIELSLCLMVLSCHPAHIITHEYDDDLYDTPAFFEELICIYNESKIDTLSRVYLELFTDTALIQRSKKTFWGTQLEYIKGQSTHSINVTHSFLIDENSIIPDFVGATLRSERVISNCQLNLSGSNFVKLGRVTLNSDSSIFSHSFDVDNPVVDFYCNQLADHLRQRKIKYQKISYSTQLVSKGKSQKHIYIYARSKRDLSSRASN